MDAGNRNLTIPYRITGFHFYQNNTISAVSLPIQQDGKRDRVGGRWLVRLPTSHTTVRTVRYTAVPQFTQWQICNKKRSTETQLFPAVCWKGLREGLGCWQFASSLFLNLPRFRHWSGLRPISLNCDTLSWHASNVSSVPCGFVSSSTRQYSSEIHPYSQAYSSSPILLQIASAFASIPRNSIHIVSR